MMESMHVPSSVILLLLLVGSLISCDESMVEQSTTPEEITVKEPRLKSMVSTAFLTEQFGPDSATFEERVSITYDTTGRVIDRKQYIIDSTILYKHQYYVQARDTLIEVVKDINNVYRPRIEYDTTKYLNDLVIERTFIRSYRFRSTPNGREEEYPIPTKVYYTYDEAGILVSTRTLHDGTENYCTYTYDSADILLAQTFTRAHTDSVYYEQKYFYNEKGLKVKQTETSFAGDSILGQYVRYYRYNEADSLAYQSWYRDGKNFAIYQYTYDEFGRKLAELIYNDGSGDSTLLAMQTHYYYNAEEQLALISILGHKNEPMRTTYFFYNADGYKVEERRYTHTIDTDGQKYMTRLVTRFRYEFF